MGRWFDGSMVRWIDGLLIVGSKVRWFDGSLGPGHGFIMADYCLIPRPSHL